MNDPHPLSVTCIQKVASIPGLHGRDDEAFGVVVDLSESNVALDEQSVMRFARTLAFGDGKTSVRPAAIAAGAHRSYIACLFAQLPQAERVIGVFGTTAEARAWLADRGNATVPLPASSARRARRP